MEKSNHVQETYHAIAMPIDDDVFVILPDEFGIGPGEWFEASRDGDTITLKPITEDASK